MNTDNNEAAAVWIDIETLKAWDNNPRLNSEAVDYVARSIRRFGFASPIIARTQDNTIIAGHTRYEAAKSLGLSKVPVRYMSLDVDEAQLLALTDNKVGEIADWDNDKLSEILKEYSLDELGDLGWSDEDLNELLNFEDEPAGWESGERPHAIPPEYIPVTQRGDLWTLGRHKLICDDCTDLEVLKRLSDGYEIDLVFTDPPYGVNAVTSKGIAGGGGTLGFTDGKTFKSLPNEQKRTLDKAKQSQSGVVGFGSMGLPDKGKPAPVPAKLYPEIIGDDTTDTAKAFYETCIEAGLENYIIWGGNYFTDFLPPSSKWLIWDKNNVGNMFADAELAWTSYGGIVRIFRHTWSGLLREGSRELELKERIHPTQKPVTLFIEIFKEFKFKVCYDGFMGSGSTLIAAERSDKVCLGAELSEAYCDRIIERWQNLTGLEAVDSNGVKYNERAGKDE